MGTIESPGHLEGGDWIAFGSICFVQQGLRTDEEGIMQMLRNNWAGCHRLIVAVDHEKSMQTMHLDTIFNIVDQKRVVLLEGIKRGVRVFDWQLEKNSYVEVKKMIYRLFSLNTHSS